MFDISINFEDFSAYIPLLKYSAMGLVLKTLFSLFPFHMILTSLFLVFYRNLTLLSQMQILKKTP